MNEINSHLHYIHAKYLQHSRYGTWPWMCRNIASGNTHCSIFLAGKENTKKENAKKINNVYIYIYVTLYVTLYVVRYVNIPCWMHLNIFKSPSNVSASVEPSQRNVPLGFIVLQWWVWEDPNEKNRSCFTMASIGYSMLIGLWDNHRLFEESHPDWNHYPSG